MYCLRCDRRSMMSVRRGFAIGSALALGVCAVLGALAIPNSNATSSRRHCVAAVGAEGQLCVAAVGSHQYRVTGRFLAPASTVAVRGVGDDADVVLADIAVGRDGRVANEGPLVSVSRPVATVRI